MLALVLLLGLQGSTEGLVAGLRCALHIAVDLIDVPVIVYLACVSVGQVVDALVAYELLWRPLG